MIYLELPWLPPSSNHAYMNTGFGGRTLSKEGQRFKRETTAHFVREYPHVLKGFQKDTPYGIYVRFWFDTIVNKGWPEKAKERYKRFDASNRLKLLEDALKDAAGIDDSQHLLVLVEKRQGKERTEVFAWNLDEEVTPFDAFIRLGTV